MQRAEYQVPRERGLNGHFACFRVTNFAHQNHIRSLSQHRLNNQHKIQANTMLDFHLIDARQIVFNRVFRRNDLAIRAIQFSQGM